MTYASELASRAVGLPVAALGLLAATAELASLFHPPLAIGSALIYLGGAALGVWLAAKVLRPGLAALGQGWLALLAGRAPRDVRRGAIDLVVAAAELAFGAWLLRRGVREAWLPATFAGVVLAFTAVFFGAGAAIPRLVGRAPASKGRGAAPTAAPAKFLALATLGLALSFAAADRLPELRFRGRPRPLSYGTWVHACAIAGGDEWCPADGRFVVVARRPVRLTWHHSGPCVVHLPSGSATDKDAFAVLPGDASIRIEATSAQDTCWYSLRYRAEPR